MTEKELVLKLGVEAGGTTIYRTALESGGWEFHDEGSSMYLEDNDDEAVHSWRSEGCQSLEEALRRVAGGDSWVLY